MSYRSGLSHFYDLRLREFAGKKREYSGFIRSKKKRIADLESQPNQDARKKQIIAKEKDRLDELQYALKYLKQVEKERKAEVDRQNRRNMRW